MPALRERHHGKPPLKKIQTDTGGLFGVSLSQLALLRASPPPIVAELEALLLAHLTTASKLSAALDAANHPSLRQPLDALCDALDAHGAHAALANALGPGHHLGGRPFAEAAPPLALGVLLRLLQRLPTPVVPCDVYNLVLRTSMRTLATLMRKRLPAAHAALLDALGVLLGRLLLQCGVDPSPPPPRSMPASPVAASGAASPASSPSRSPASAASASTSSPVASPAEQERATHALLYALVPCLLRPTPEADGPPAEDRVAATHAVRSLLKYFCQRQQYRVLTEAASSLAGVVAGGVVAGGVVAGGVVAGGAARTVPPTSPATPATGGANSDGRFEASRESCTPPAHAAAAAVTTTTAAVDAYSPCSSAASPATSATVSPGASSAASSIGSSLASGSTHAGAGGGLPTRPIASAIYSLFEREFGAGRDRAGGGGSGEATTSSAQRSGAEVERAETDMARGARSADPSAGSAKTHEQQQPPPLHLQPPPAQQSVHVDGKGLSATSPSRTRGAVLGRRRAADQVAPGRPSDRPAPEEQSFR